jgi:hypothetical protein
VSANAPALAVMDADAAIARRSGWSYRRSHSSRHVAVRINDRKGKNVMYDIMSGGMMWGMGFFWLLVIILVLLAIAALAKYLFFGGGR